MIDFNSPSGPVISSPRSRAALTSCAIAAFSLQVAVDDDRFLASLGIKFMLVIVSVTGDQPSPPAVLACQARNTVWRTVPRNLGRFTVGAGCGVVGHADLDDVVQGGAGLPVPAAAEAVPVGAPGGHGDGRGAAQGRE